MDKFRLLEEYDNHANGCFTIDTPHWRDQGKRTVICRLYCSKELAESIRDGLARQDSQCGDEHRTQNACQRAHNYMAYSLGVIALKLGEGGHHDHEELAEEVLQIRDDTEAIRAGGEPKNPTPVPKKRTGDSMVDDLKADQAEDARLTRLRQGVTPCNRIDHDIVVANTNEPNEKL